MTFKGLNVFPSVSLCLYLCSVFPRVLRCNLWPPSLAIFHRLVFDDLFDGPHTPPPTPFFHITPSSSMCSVFVMLSFSTPEEMTENMTWPEKHRKYIQIWICLALRLLLFDLFLSSFLLLLCVCVCLCLCLCLCVCVCVCVCVWLLNSSDLSLHQSFHAGNLCLFFVAAALLMLQTSHSWVYLSSLAQSTQRTELCVWKRL